MDHIDTTEVIGAGHFPDERHVLATWEAGSTEAPIHINHNGVRGLLKPNTMTLMTANIAQMLVESGFEVTINYDAIVNPGTDEAIDEAVALMEAARAKAAALAKMKVEDLLAELPACDLNTLRFALEAEEAGKKRGSAIAAIEAAIDTHPDQLAALEAAAAEAAQNDENGAAESEGSEQAS